jgi:hypothetical protein
MSRTSTRRSARSALAVILALLLALVAGASASSEELVDTTSQMGVSALAQDTCPDGIDGWLKYDVDVQGDFPLYYEGILKGTATTNSPGIGQVQVFIPAGWKADLCVKGANEVVFAYALISGQYTEPVNTSSGNLADVSHFSYRLTPPEYTGQWCSPGFWKNNPMAWPAPYTADSLYGDTGLTFGYILANPKFTAKTGAYEGVADILSTAHAGVDFLGDRVADSCPLAADASLK